MITATRLNGIGEYYFSAKLSEIEALNREGKKVINLGIGSPDLPPHPDVVRVLQEESMRSDVHAYQGYKGVPALRGAFAAWYRRWFDVSLDAGTEILPLIGSKEGILHICMTYLDAGDKALIPDPGYPAYASAVRLAGGTAVPYDLTEERDYAPDFDRLEQVVSGGGFKLMWVSYPHMPTGQGPSAAVFEKLVAFGRKHRILICHDNPYSFILNDNRLSLLQVDGAMEVALELNSLSKSHHMAGWRVGVLCAAKERIGEVLRFKSNMDSGTFLPVQLAAAHALSLDAAWHDEMNAIYHARREQVYGLLDMLQCRYSRSQVGLFVWAGVPGPYADGYAFSDEVLYKAGVFLTPGGIFGSNGRRYIRVSLCGALEQLEEAKTRIGKEMIWPRLASPEYKPENHLL